MLFVPMQVFFFSRKRIRNFISIKIKLQRSDASSILWFCIFYIDELKCIRPRWRWLHIVCPNKHRASCSQFQFLLLYESLLMQAMSTLERLAIKLYWYVSSIKFIFHVSSFILSHLWTLIKWSYLIFYLKPHSFRKIKINFVIGHGIGISRFNHR
jgi:hypothetical protein